MIAALTQRLPFLARLLGPSPTPGPEAPERKPAHSLIPDPTDISLEGFDDPSRAIRFGYIVIIVGLGTFLLWATFAPIAEGVPAHGVVVVESQRKPISHLTGGTIASVQIQENLPVKQGDILLTMDTGRLQTALDTVLHEYVNTSARLARLTAEQTFSSKIDYSDELRKQITELSRNDIFTAQEQLLQVRQQSFFSEQNILKEGLSASQMQASGMRQQVLNRKHQSALLNQEVAGNRALVEEGYAPRNRLLEQERQLTEMSYSTTDLQTRLAREISSGAEIRLRMFQRRQEYLKEVETQATDARRELAVLGERLKDTQLDLQRATIRAPVSGQVVSMAPLTVGSVVNPGTKLLEIVPVGDRLLIDVQVPVHIINRIHTGLEADIRITSFPGTPTLLLPGKVLSISLDRHETQTGLPPYYLARVEVTAAGIKKLGDRTLKPGMDADVVIKTGERSFIAYLMSPVTRQLFMSFKEP